MRWVEIAVFLLHYKCDVNNLTSNGALLCSCALHRRMLTYRRRPAFVRYVTTQEKILKYRPVPLTIIKFASALHGFVTVLPYAFRIQSTQPEWNLTLNYISIFVDFFCFFVYNLLVCLSLLRRSFFLYFHCYCNI